MVCVANSLYDITNVALLLQILLFSSVVFKNEWSYTSAPLVYVRGVDKDKLTLHSLNVAFGSLRCERFAELQIWLLCKDSGNVSTCSRLSGFCESLLNGVTVFRENIRGNFNSVLRRRGSFPAAMAAE